MKLLILTSRFPYPLEKGDKLRLYNQLKVLSAHFELVLVSMFDDPITADHLNIVKELVSEVHLIPISKLQRSWSLFKTIFTQAPFRNKFFYSAKAKQKIQEIIKLENPDHIYCQLIRMADYVKDQNIPTTLDFMDAFSTGLEKRFKMEQGLRSFFYKTEYKRTLKYEEEIAKRLTNFTIISHQDKEKMPSKAISVVKNGIDLSYFKPQDAIVNFDLLFVGNLGYYPNVQAAKYLANKVMPLLGINKSLLLAGARPTQEVKSLSNNQISLIPWLEDIRTAYRQASVFVAPLFVGIGQQNKILESMAMGLPCVTTSEVNNAIGAKPGVEILIADTPQEFVMMINKLEDKAFYQSVRSKALEFINTQYSWEKATQPLVQLIKSKK